VNVPDTTELCTLSDKFYVHYFHTSSQKSMYLEYDGEKPRKEGGLLPGQEAIE
jgi:hypothetical protein